MIELSEEQVREFLEALPEDSEIRLNLAPQSVLDKWDLRFINLAKEIAQWSKDPSTKVGAVLVGHKRQILAQGYNGFPRGIEDTPERLNNPELKRELVVHAEMNCTINAAFSGARTEGSTMYVWGLPSCHRCAAEAIIQAGVIRVVMPSLGGIPQHWEESMHLALEILQEAGVSVTLYQIEE